MTDLPWANTTIDSWLEDIISTCVNPKIACQLIPKVKQILFSNQNNDSLQYPLYQILGGTSFEVIETLLKYRDQLQASSLNVHVNNDNNSQQKNVSNKNSNRNQQLQISAPMVL